MHEYRIQKIGDFRRKLIGKTSFLPDPGLELE
jgi:hypothetical protein